MGISRRRMIQGTAAGTVLAAGSVMYVQSEVPSDRVTVLKRYLGSLQDLNALGSAYLVLDPNADIDTLVEEIFSRAGVRSAANQKISYRDLKAFQLRFHRKI